MRSSKGHGSLSNLEKKRLKGDLVTVYSLLSRGSGEVGAELFSIGSTYRTHGKWFKAAPEEAQTGH